MNNNRYQVSRSIGIRRSTLPGRLVEEHDRWIIDQFQRNGQPLALTAGQIPAHRGFIIQETQTFKHVIHLNAKTQIYHSMNTWQHSEIIDQAIILICSIKPKNIKDQSLLQLQNLQWVSKTKATRLIRAVMGDSLKPRPDMLCNLFPATSCMSRQNEQLVDATSCLFEQQKVAPGGKLRNVEHVQLWATCCPNNTTRPNRQQVARQQVACLDGALEQLRVVLKKTDYKRKRKRETETTKRLRLIYCQLLLHICRISEFRNLAIWRKASLLFFLIACRPKKSTTQTLLSTNAYTFATYHAFLFVCRKLLG